MRTILFVIASLTSSLVIGCGDSSGGSGGSGGETGTGTGGATATAGAGGVTTPTGTGGAGGSMSMGGSTSTGGAATGGAGGASSGAKLGEMCATDADCQSGLICYNFNAKGMLCTKTCTTSADCPPPSSGCNGMGYCKPN